MLHNLPPWRQRRTKQRRTPPSVTGGPSSCPRAAGRSAILKAHPATGLPDGLRSGRGGCGAADRETRNRGGLSARLLEAELIGPGDQWPKHQRVIEDDD